MAVSFTWVVSSLELSKTAENYPDLVVTVHWRLKGQDDEDGLSSEVFGADSLEPPQEGESFVPFADLTEQLVTSWLEQKFVTEEVEGTNRLAHLKDVVASQIQDKRTPKIVSMTPPWLA